MNDPDKAMASARQLVLNIIWRVEFGDGPLFPRDREELAIMMADAACGILHADIPASLQK